MGTSRHSRRYWTEKLAEYWDSELTLSDYCEIMELPYRAALRWVQIFKKENQEQTPECQQAFRLAGKQAFILAGSFGGNRPAWYILKTG